MQNWCLTSTSPTIVNIALWSEDEYRTMHGKLIIVACNDEKNKDRKFTIVFTTNSEKDDAVIFTLDEFITLMKDYKAKISQQPDKPSDESCVIFP